MIEESQPNLVNRSPSGVYQIHAESVGGFSLEKLLMPFLVPLLSSLIGAAASYTAIRKDIQVNQERVIKLESNRVILEGRINDFQTRIAVIEVRIDAIKTTKRRR